ncbi:MAG: phosphoribosyltransferase, partial [Jatrophihabitantaceae bacterium]|nr:phosphoribosyltransferase [Jatrophihabitantaceae bacterium]
MTPRTTSGADGWAERATGIAIADRDSLIGVGVTDLVRLGLRDNPKRLHLLVSRVLGKHVPTDPRIVLGAGWLLGVLVCDVLTGSIPDGAPGRVDADLHAAGDTLRRALGGDLAAAGQLPGQVRALMAARAAAGVPATVVLGFAETATAVGHCVSDALPASRYLHSSRRVVPGVAPAAGFVEAHSHAPDHLLLPDTPEFLTAGAPDEVLVLVDDELSTGATAANTIEA